MSIGIRVAYPEQGNSWLERLKKYEEIDCIELAFYKPELFHEIKVADVIAPFDSLSIKVSSIHMAQERLKNFESFFSILSKTIEIAKNLDCDKIVVHPSRDRGEEVETFVHSKITPLLKENKIELCWETFESKKRFLSGIEEIGKFCENNEWHKACYDFSHISGSQEKVIEDLKKYKNCIKIFHMSNRISEPRKQHLPIFEKGDLDFNEIIRVIKESYTDVELVLEYLYEYHYKLDEDALRLKETFDKKDV